MENGRPAVGRTVHYQSFGTPNGEYKSLPRAAIITEVGEWNALEELPRVSLAILNPTGMFFTQNVRYSSEPKPGCWTWMPKEE